MKLRTRLAATALAAGSLLGTTGAFVGTAHAGGGGDVPQKLPGTVKIDPCVISPDLCKPKPSGPQLPGDKVPVKDLCKLVPELCKPGGGVLDPGGPKDPGKPPTDPKDPGKPPTTKPEPKPEDKDDIVVVNVDTPVKGSPTFTG